MHDVEEGQQSAVPLNPVSVSVGPNRLEVVSTIQFLESPPQKSGLEVLTWPNPVRMVSPRDSSRSPVSTRLAWSAARTPPTKRSAPLASTRESEAMSSGSSTMALTIVAPRAMLATCKRFFLVGLLQNSN
jgi:hypothetical protein